ncbi:MAG: hypothetical protein A2020_13845 [Lentisphaerae bacterium GWF2_45_14]|nr:MAG: hypothetical protein A2020_13845 [Lentisphaerae bacterium GWF2_45_14]
MKIALVNPRGTSTPELSIPHGLLQIGAELEAAGHEFKIVNYNDIDIPLNYEPLKSYDLVGLSVNTLQLAHAKKIAESIGDSTKIVWGGIHCLLDPESIMKSFPAHFLVKGEGEQPLLDIVRHLEGKESIDWLAARKGVCFTDKGRRIENDAFFNEDLNQLHDINYYRLDNLEKYLYSQNFYVPGAEKLGKLSILTARGCHWNCSFCINTLLARHGGTYRAKSFEKIRRETEPIIDGLGIRFLFPADEDFFLNKGMPEAIMGYAKEKNFFWGANCRYNYFVEKIINKGKLAEYVDGGLFFIGMSIEAGDEEIRNSILKKMVKDVHIDNAVDTIENSVGNRLAINTSFIINFPGDTQENRLKMLLIMDRLSRHLNIVFSGPQSYRTYPGSTLSELDNEAQGYKTGDMEYYIKSVSESGTPLSLMDNSTYFYTQAVNYFFNQRFKFFELHEDNGRFSLHLTTRKKKASLVRKLFLFAVNLLFIPVLIRLRFNFWGCFFEPFIVGWCMKRINNTFSLYQRLTGRHK